MFSTGKLRVLREAQIGWVSEKYEPRQTAKEFENYSRVGIDKSL
jgi:hypothetical protein